MISYNSFQCFKLLKLLGKHHLFSLFISSTLDLSNEYFKEHVAKLVNAVASEILKCWESGYDSSLELKIANISSTACEDIQIRSLELLEQIYPLIIKLLGDEFDDTSSTLFPFVTLYTTYLKKVKKLSEEYNPKQIDSITILIKTLISKLRIDAEESEEGIDEFKETREVPIPFILFFT